MSIFVITNLFHVALTPVGDMHVCSVIPETLLRIMPILSDIQDYIFVCCCELKCMSLCKSLSKYSCKYQLYCYF